tara:strand:+ start:296 stop:613 length:318 start_codon:yes stop_codon:yes gene_type:complete
MDFKNKNIESIIDSMYGFTLSLYSDGDNYLTSGYKLEDFNNKDEYNSLLNEYKDRIKIFLNQKKMKKIYENMTKKKYNKDTINLNEMDDKMIEEIYIKMYELDIS